MELLRMGSSGPDVEQLQEVLAERGFYNGTVDGDFGPGTERAVKAFQRSEGLVVDGLVGERTFIEMQLDDQKQPDWALREQDIEDAAAYLDVEVEALRAVSEVESSGGGFHHDGTIKVLFERHWMLKRLMHYDLTLAAELGQKYAPDIVNADRGGYSGGVEENQRLDKAMSLNPSAAIEAASYGRFQIMGFHWKRLGYESPQHYYDSVCEGEHKQLESFVRFIEADNRLLDALRELDWAGFAYAYNGSAYEENRYDEKMEEAYERFMRE